MALAFAWMTHEQVLQLDMIQPLFSLCIFMNFMVIQNLSSDNVTDFSVFLSREPIPMAGMAYLYHLECPHE